MTPACASCPNGQRRELSPPIGESEVTSASVSDDAHQSDDPDQLGRALNREAVLGAVLPELADEVTIGRFEALECIGRGGFGVVYLASDPLLGRMVAVKWCPDPAPDTIERFQREAKILARFSHPNIVTLHEVGWHGKDFFCAMEFVEGCDGAQYIASKPHWLEALKVYEAAATGLAAAHAQGIVHADFKPANVLIGNDGRVRVADFGLAQSIGQANRDDASELSGPWGGTLPYMAPELWTGAQPNASTDQFVLCVALWETLYRRRPFEGTSPMGLFAAMTSGKPRVSCGAPAVSRVLRDALLKGLSADPNDRHQSVQALIDVFAEIRSPMATLAMSSTPPAGGRRSWLPYVEGAGVMLVLGLAGVLGVLGWLDRPVVEHRESDRPRDEPPPPSIVEPPCALGDESIDLDSTVIEVCQLIRDGHFQLADGGWDAERLDRLSRNAAGLGEHTLIIARTFVDQAEAIQLSMPEEARAAATIAQTWVPKAAAQLGEDDLRVEDVKDRADAIAPPASD
jgi:serine/threonine protein kinase